MNSRRTVRDARSHFLFAEDCFYEAMSKVAQFLRPDQRCDIAQLRGIVADAVTEKTLEVCCANFSSSLR